MTQRRLELRGQKSPISIIWPIAYTFTFASAQIVTVVLQSITTTRFHLQICFNAVDLEVAEYISVAQRFKLSLFFIAASLTHVLCFR